MTPAHHCANDERDCGAVPKRFHRRYPAVPESVAAVRSALVVYATRAGASGRLCADLALAASEAVTNVVVHAYREWEIPGTVEVTAVVDTDGLLVTIIDAGTGLRPRLDSPGLGLGLAVIAQAADGLDVIQPSAGGLELRMRFVLPGAATGD
jgi:serine/threonine-protein kinase RsbW